jgi:hypothetical protein
MPRKKSCRVFICPPDKYERWRLSHRRDGQLLCSAECLHHHPHRPHLRYCSSLTFSIQSTFLPFTVSWIAM